ncbi:hypothetical protein BH10PSE14_BH10PSE14_37670 [soil metagenome]
MKLIFVDDSDIWRDEATEVAGAQGVSIVTYALPVEVDASELESANVVITDNKFGSAGFLGVDFIRSIRAAGFAGDVVLYTSCPRQGDLRELTALGGRVVDKSVFPDALVRSLHAF